MVIVVVSAALVFFFVEAVLVVDVLEEVYDEGNVDGDKDGDDDVDVDALFFEGLPCHGAWALPTATKHRNAHALSQPIVQRVDRTVKAPEETGSRVR